VGEVEQNQLNEINQHQLQ